MKYNLTNVLRCIIILSFISFIVDEVVDYKVKKETAYTSFKRGCMMQGGSLQLCNVAATEYVKIK
jgi:hypothetical protein